MERRTEMNAKEFLLTKYPNIDWEDKTGAINGSFWVAIAQIMEEYRNQHCPFELDYTITSATKCKLCGLEQWQHVNQPSPEKEKLRERFKRDSELMNELINTLSLTPEQSENLNKLLRP